MRSIVAIFDASLQEARRALANAEHFANNRAGETLERTDVPRCGAAFNVKPKGDHSGEDREARSGIWRSKAHTSRFGAVCTYAAEPRRTHRDRSYVCIYIDSEEGGLGNEANRHYA